jgi:hypothetical protein
MNWQPIATAPKDGTHVDLWVNGQRLPDCWWFEADDVDAYWVQRYSETKSAFFDVDGEPTHWMPIPKGPE